MTDGSGTGKAVVKKETLRLRRGQKGSPWKVLDFSMGEGIAAKGKLSSYEDVNLATRERQKLDSPDILAIKGLGQFKEFETVTIFRKLIEDWHVSDFRIDAARDRQEIEYCEHLTRSALWYACRRLFSITFGTSFFLCCIGSF